jgi:hypothetical protein
MMNPDTRNANKFKHPGDRLLRLHGTITEEEMHNSDTYDSNGELGIMVMKLGRTTDLTVGRANNIFFCTRHYGENDFGYSMEWAISALR